MGLLDGVAATSAETFSELLATSLGEWFDALTVAGMAAGLRERLS